MLTKSDFIKFIQCPKFLWLYKNRKDLIPEDIGISLQRIFDEGYHVESFAYELFPGGIDAEVKDNFKESIIKTKELMDSRTPVIFQPTISASSISCRADIIKLNEDGTSWDIYEVKSATQVKDINKYDLSFQKICFESAGYKVGKINLVFINNQYARDGDIEPSKLFQTEDITNDVIKMEADTKIKIQMAQETLTSQTELKVRILKQCNTPYNCTFLDYCHKDIPDKSIYDIFGKLPEDKLNMLIDEGIIFIKDVPEGVITNKSAIRQHHAEKHDEVHIEKDNIKKELNKIEYPIYFLDYETFAPGVPLFDGYRPYQKMTFQYSLHVQESPNKEVKHYAYLAKNWEDPSKDLATDLSRRIGNKGTVIAWNMGFEKARNTDIGNRYPKHQEFFEDINNRMYDLMGVFQKGYYVHKDFHGSASLKRVLPVMVPDLSYKDNPIQEGMEASNKWRDMIDQETPKQEKENIHQALLKYCELDTLSMVEILKVLQALIL